MQRSPVWDQGKEIHGHEALATSAGLTVDVCNPHGPWQRDSNENANGLLRQWFPRSTIFYLLDPPGHRWCADLAQRPVEVPARVPNASDVLAAAC